MATTKKTDVKKEAPAVAEKVTDQAIDINSMKDTLKAQIMKEMEDEITAKLEAQYANKKTDEEELSPEVKKIHEKEAERMKQRVKITLFKDNGKYKDAVFVSDNGVNYIIQRGVEVEVPLSVALILKQAEKQRDIAIKNQTALQNSYQKNKDALE